MEQTEDGIRINGILIPFTEDQKRAIKTAEHQESKNKRLERLGFSTAKKDDKYYCIDSSCEVLTSINDEDFVDNKRRKVRNFFVSKVDAEKEVKRRAILNDLILNSDPEGNWQIYFSNRDNSLSSVSTNCPKIGQPTFTKEKAFEMIDKWGEDLNLLRYI